MSSIKDKVIYTSITILWFLALFTVIGILANFALQDTQKINELKDIQEKEYKSGAEICSENKSFKNIRVSCLEENNVSDINIAAHTCLRDFESSRNVTKCVKERKDKLRDNN